MAISGTYSFAPSVGEVGLYAYSRCGVRRTELTQQHMEDLRMAANMVCVEFSNQGVNLWQVDLVTQPLTAGQGTYNVDPATVVILDAYVSVNGIDRLILPISRSEYASYPNKQQQGVTTVYWNNRLLAPTVTLWMVPDGTVSSLSYYLVRHLQDATVADGGSPDVPYLWLKAFSDALSVELAVIWKPEAVSYLTPIADKSYRIAADQNIEIAQQFISPTINPYFRP